MLYRQAIKILETIGNQKKKISFSKLCMKSKTTYAHFHKVVTNFHKLKLVKIEVLDNKSKTATITPKGIRINALYLQLNDEFKKKK